ncbi:phage DNA transposition protein [Ralstonia phage RS138]|uniref:phage DNA transposition protein n=1 Tax=Ralstonia phage RS138 TaxID=1483485 RepID=UPI0006BCE6CD|nr:phage DNA transposition protein [Ralstonia phage RS138]BAS32806.1 phage DNA transposition protein [Ralstonia phage RS138]
MTKNTNTGKPAVGPIGGVAHIATLDLVSATLERLDARRNGLPGIAVLYGAAGWGKTFAANALGQRNARLLRADAQRVALQESAGKKSCRKWASATSAPRCRNCWTWWLSS